MIGLIRYLAPIYIPAHLIAWGATLAILGILGGATPQCGADIHPYLCGSPLAPINASAGERPSLTEHSEGGGGALGAIGGGIQQVAGMIGAVWGFIKTVWALFTFDYAILSDRSFLGLVGIGLRIAGGIYTGLVLLGLFALIRGSN